MKIGRGSFPHSAITDVGVSDHHTKYTDAEALAAAQKGVDYGLSFQAVVTTLTDATHFKAAELTGFGNDFFNGYFAYVVHDSGGSGGAPQGQVRPISDYVSADGTFTHTAFTVPLVTTDVLLIMHRYASYLDELAPANLPTDIAAIPTSLQFSEYTYTAALAIGASFTPPAGTIIMIANMGGVDAADDFQLTVQGVPIASVTYASGPTRTGFYGSIYIRGSGDTAKFKNNDSDQNIIYLSGVSMS